MDPKFPVGTAVAVVSEARPDLNTPLTYVEEILPPVPGQKFRPSVGAKAFDYTGILYRVMGITHYILEESLRPVDDPDDFQALMERMNRPSEVPDQEMA